MYYLNTASHVMMNSDNIDLLRNAISKMYNPSDDGEYAERAKDILSCAKKSIIQSVSKLGNWNKAMDVYDVIFTSSGSAANNLALLQMDVVATTHIEHSSIHDNPHATNIIEISSCGYVNLDALRKIDFKDSVDGVSVQYVNNELGIVQPVNEIVKIVHENNALVHIDAVQAYGNIDFDIVDLDADFISLSGHKIGALAGIGCLIVKKNLIPSMKPLIYGEQEYGVFGGTENLAGIYSWQLAINNWSYADSDNKKTFLSYLDEEMKSNGISYVINPFNEPFDKEHFNLDDIIKNGKYDNKTISIAFDGVNGESLKLALEIYDVIVSNGSACNTGNESYVLKAIDNCKSNVYNTIRIRLPSVKCTDSTKRDMRDICRILAKAVKRVRRM